MSAENQTTVVAAVLPKKSFPIDLTIVYRCNICQVIFETKLKRIEHKIIKHKLKIPIPPDVKPDVKPTLKIKSELKKEPKVKVEKKLFNLDHTTADIVKMEKVRRSSAADMKNIQCLRCKVHIRNPYKIGSCFPVQDPNGSPNKNKAYSCKYCFFH